MIKRIKKNQLFFIFIIFLAGFLRFYKLGNIPDGFFVDESAIGYNAYSILKTGRDEWGELLPLYFRSLGDYKLPVYFYLTVPVIFLGGLNEFSVRFLSALAGSLTVVITFLFARDFYREKLSKNKQNRKQSFWVGFLAAFFLCFEPWHIHFSRIALETNVALFFTVFGFFLLFFAKKIKSKRAILGYLFLGTAFFTYLSPRLFIPLLALTFFFVSKTKQRKEGGRKWSLVLILFLLLFATVFLDPRVLSRVKGISILHPFSQEGFQALTFEKLTEHKQSSPWLKLIHNKAIELFLKFSHQYLNHFSPDFLFFEGESFNLRFKIPFMGNLLLFELPFFLFGLYFLIKSKKYFFPLWIFLAPFASALSFQSPSSLRSNFILVAFEIIAAIGFMTGWRVVKNKLGKLKWPVILIIISLFLINLIYFLDNYFVHQLVHEPYYWNYDFKKIVLKAKELEADYDEIIIGEYGGTLHHLLFFQKIDPQGIWDKIERQEIDRFGFVTPKRFGKYYFDPFCSPGDVSKGKTLYICPHDVTEENYRILDRMNYKDNKLNFIFYENKK